MTEPRLTIVTVCFNCVTDIEETIKSVVAQKEYGIEYIVVDGASKDGTTEIIRKYIGTIDTFICEPDKGIYDAMNKGIMAATGQWIYFLNAGDILCDGGLKAVPFAICVTDDNLCGIIGKIKVCRHGTLYEHCVGKPFFEVQKKFKNMGFSHQGVFIKTVLAKENPFDTSYRLCADYDMMVRLYNKGYRFDRLGEYIAIIKGGDGASALNRKLQLLEEGRVCGCDKDFSFKMLVAWRSLKLFLHKVLKR